MGGVTKLAGDRGPADLPADLKSERGVEKAFIWRIEEQRERERSELASNVRTVF